ncbi:ABC transporter permease [Salipaludibacillus daqingensis]|uniref:ABC transporter permease n=1 Tax=Salipaludibacillus daqingensis TaxID=3041001 RepID=UPI002474E4DE|nr:ABC transporter permease [Salipaludibacillus daqingensis]
MMFSNVLKSEWLKLKHSKVVFIVLASPVLATVIGLFTTMHVPEHQWLGTITTMILAHSAIFLPLLTGVFAALICRHEHSGGGWKQVLTLPVSRLQIYFAKFIVILFLLTLTQTAFITATWVAGTLKGFSDPFPFVNVFVSAGVGWLACLPLIALQLWLATMLKSFAGPSVVNVMLTFPAVVIANSPLFGPMYPWAHPLLGMTQALSYSLGGDAGFLDSAVTFYVVMITSFALFTAVGSVHFQQREWV